MLWLCLHPHRLSLEALDTTTGDDVVVHHKGDRRWVVDGMAPIAAGTDLAAALALHALRIVKRKPEAERHALHQLAHFADQLGAPVHLAMEEPRSTGSAPAAGVWVEGAASLKLFGGLAKLRAHVAESIQLQHLSIKPGLAPTIEGALLDAQAGVVLDSPARLRRRLNKQPLEVLRLSTQALSTCRGSGMRTAGEVLAVPADQLARRFKPLTPDYLRRRSVK